MRAALIVLLLASSASAYVRTRTTKVGAPAAWPGSCAFVTPDIAGTPDLTAAQTFPVIQKSLNNWNISTAACSYFALNYVDPAPVEAHYDGTNVIKFRTDRWCHPNDKENNNVCYSDQAAAITSVYMIDSNNPKDGLILDADVEMNNINFTFIIMPPTGGTPPATPHTPADLENTLTHELGHLLGLSHTCRDGASGPHDVDENGQPIPDCTMLAALDQATRDRIILATMYNYAVPGEVIKRSPSPDDVAGICAAYPLGELGDRTCEVTDLSKYTSSCGVAMGGRARGLVGPIWLVALAVASLGLRRRLVRAPVERSKPRR